MVNYAFVIGSPIKQSKSPLIHKYWLRHYGIEGDYRAIEVKEEELPSFIGKLRDDPDCKGGNVTIPHKETVLEFLDDVDPLAMKMGAVNTIVKRADETLFGTNTDGFGFIAHLKATLPDYDIAHHAVTILGAGGAARGIITALLEEGVPEIHIINRNRERAQKLHNAFGSRLHIHEWKNYHEALPVTGLLVNTTSLGMAGQERLDINIDLLPVNAAVYDIVYNPLETDLLKQAKARHLKTIDGLGMLLHQARPGFNDWFGRMPDVTPGLRSEIEKALQ